MVLDAHELTALSELRIELEFSTENDDLQIRGTILVFGFKGLVHLL